MTRNTIIFCEPLSNYPEQPQDISPCTLEDCQECGEKMWVSEKKMERKVIKSVIEVEVEKIDDINYAFRFSIDKLSQEIGVPKERLARSIADALLKSSKSIFSLR